MSNSSRGVVLAGGRQISCALGRSGITCQKREGDGATPAGRYRFVSGFYRPDRENLAQTGLPLSRIATNSGWCDDPDDRNYNRAVKLPYNSSHEKLLREDRLYDWCLVLDQNYSKRMRGLGSAIFFHIATPDFRSTEGCVAIQPNDMRWLIGHIGRHTFLEIIAR